MLTCRGQRLGSWVRHRLLRWLSGEPLSLDEQEITESLKALHTLRCEGGRVSIDPAEVLDRPGYLAARAAATALVRGAPEGRRAIDEAAQNELEDLMLRYLISLVHRGKTFEEAQTVLRDAMCESIRQLSGVQGAEVEVVSGE